MPLPLAEIRSRAFAFAREWASAFEEIGEAQPFLEAFFNVFGITRRRVATFEKRIHRRAGGRGRIDLLWKGQLLVEMKSRGEDLERAYRQATDYFDGLEERDLPRRIMVCDFARFRLYDLDTNDYHEFVLEDLPDRLDLFGFISGWEPRRFEEQAPVNRDAAERMGRLHDALKEQGYEGHRLEVLLVRLVFCLFAEDTGIFPETGAFRTFIETRTQPDGSDLGTHLNHFFEVLGTPEAKRPRNLPEDLKSLPYVNGKLYEETLSTPQFDAALRSLLLDACALDWGAISPAIFGALFQSIMDRRQRRNFGAHYTSEGNILKALGPLFLDNLRDRFEKARGSKLRLRELHDEIARLGVFDPACGCGNFLVVAYRELRRIELDILRALYPDGLPELDASLIRLDVDQFFGIELFEFPAQIAQLAMWLVDHQMNNEASRAFGRALVRLPLVHAANIVHGNALRLDWRTVAPRDRVTYVVGNPPFVGAREKSAEQSDDVRQVFGTARGAGELDYVACWYRKAAEYIDGLRIRCALVSTNSITQGEQPGILWTILAPWRLCIHFAHRTFRWSNEARGVAAVHCVIIGFAQTEPSRRRLFDYASPTAPPNEILASNINAYLIDGPNVLVMPTNAPLRGTPRMAIGNKPIDGGYYLFTDRERDEFVARELGSAPYFRRWFGADGFINGTPSWCLWLGEISPSVLEKLPLAKQRVLQVRDYRLASTSPGTRKLAATPTRFHVENMPKAPYLLLPRHSSEDRAYIPIGLVGPEVLTGDSCLLVPDSDAYLFGILTSAMHMAWLRAIGGRLESRYRYSATLVY
jgi:hypothetical protein